MSIRALNWIFHDFMDVSPKKVTPTMRQILTVLANFAGDEDESYPRQTTIARITGLSRQCVCKNLSTMEKMGLISATGRTRTDGSTRSSEYTLKIDWPSNYVGPTPDEIDGGGVNQDDTGGVAQDDTAVVEDDGGVAQDDTGCQRERQGGVNQDDTINHHLEPSPEPKARTPKPRKTKAWPEDFRKQFWGLYPKKSGDSRKAAWTKLEKIERDDEVEFADLMKGLTYYAARMNADVQQDRKNERFIAAAAVWLNNARWETERPPAPKAPGNAWAGVNGKRMTAI
jgi:hypothetical protein